MITFANFMNVELAERQWRKRKHAQIPSKISYIPSSYVVDHPFPSDGCSITNVGWLNKRNEKKKKHFLWSTKEANNFEHAIIDVSRLTTTNQQRKLHKCLNETKQNRKKKSKQLFTKKRCLHICKICCSVKYIVSDMLLFQFQWFCNDIWCWNIHSVIEHNLFHGWPVKCQILNEITYKRYERSFVCVDSFIKILFTLTRFVILWSML